MAQPITWRNVNSDFDISGASAALARAGQSINSGFSGFEDIIRNQQQVNADNRQIQIDNSTQDFLNKLSAYNPAQLEQAISDGTVEQLRNSYDVRLNPTKTNGAALQELLQSRRNQVTAGQEYSDKQVEMQFREAINKAHTLLDNGETQQAQAIIGGMPAVLQAKFRERLDANADTALVNQFGSSVVKKDFGTADSVLKDMAKRGIDITPYQQQLFEARKGNALSQLLFDGQGTGNDINQATKDYNQALRDKISGMGITDITQATAEQAAEIEAFRASQKPVSPSQMVQQKLLAAKEIAEQYNSPEMYTAAKAAIEQSALEYDQLGAVGQAEVDRKFGGLEARMVEQGNIYLTDAVAEGFKGDPLDMINAALKINPDIGDLDSDSKAKLALGFKPKIDLATEDGTTVKNVPVPMEVLSRALLGINRGTFKDTDLTTVVKDLMDQGTYADDYVEAEKLKADKAAFIKTYKRNAGKADTSYANNVDNTLVELKEQFRVAREKAKEEADRKAKLENFNPFLHTKGSPASDALEINVQKLREAYKQAGLSEEQIKAALRGIK
jgi:hypothetical protein